MNKIIAPNQYPKNIRLSSIPTSKASNHNGLCIRPYGQSIRIGKIEKPVRIFTWARPANYQNVTFNLAPFSKQDEIKAGQQLDSQIAKLTVQIERKKKQLQKVMNQQLQNQQQSCPLQHTSKIEFPILVERVSNLINTRGVIQMRDKLKFEESDKREKKFEQKGEIYNAMEQRLKSIIELCGNKQN